MLLRAGLRRRIAFAPLARNGKCISVDRAQTKGRTLARGSSPSRFLPFCVAALLSVRLVASLSLSVASPSCSRPPDAPCPAPSRVTLARQIPRSRTVKGLTSRRDPLASALALVTSKVHDVIPWKRSASKITAWK